MSKIFSFFTEDSKPMVTEIQAEQLAKKACEEYMTKCNLQSIDDVRLAAAKMLAVANYLFETMHSGSMQMDIVQ